MLLVPPADHRPRRGLRHRLLPSPEAERWRPVVARPTRVLGFGNENGSDCTFGFRPGGEDGGAVVARTVLRVACGKWFTVAQVYNEQVMDEGAIEAGLEREAAAAARAEAMAAMMEEVEVEEEEEAVED